ncbi:D-inositol-3-phosphate glycosyltransferase [compost metagenome]
MACGTPIIASKIGGITDYINDGINGFSFQPGNSEELSEKILSYAKLDQDKKNDLSAGAIITANRYDSLKISSDLFSEIKKIIDTN